MKLSSVNTALKEWDAVTRAALEGRTAVLVRKGGILEQREGFSVEHDSFWLYPTFLHQNPGELRLQHHDLLRDNPEPNQVRLEAFCNVERVWKIETLETARSLEPFNALTADALERRFLYRNKPWVHAILLRVHRAEPHTTLETPAYAGCTSWVPLEGDVPVANATPVMSDLEFERVKQELEGLLEMPV
ncbi:MAG: DUF1802 family protein [Pleurocapsa sp. SU_196_0]|nr:DUF1802 family protein [Pleurocapsa sp. SU_196_0]